MPASDAGLLFDVVREAGELGLALSRKTDLQHWTKPDGSHVTEGDLAINALFEQRLRAARPGDGWLSEETPDDHRARMAQVFNPGNRLSDAQLINDYWTVLRMTEPNRNVARLQTRQGKPIWIYYYSSEAPAARIAAGVRGARHAADIPYVFNSNRSYAGEDLATAQSMNAYWASFAKYLNPGAAGGPQWDKYNVANDNLLEFGNTGPLVATKLQDALLNFAETQPRS